MRTEGFPEEVVQAGRGASAPEPGQLSGHHQGPRGAVQLWSVGRHALVSQPAGSVIHIEPGHRAADSQSDVALIAGVVTAVSFITVCVVAVVTRLLYRRQMQRNDPGSQKDKHHHHHHQQQQQHPQQRSAEEPAFRTELHLHHAMRDSIKEYYI
ncbi:hypothetical protein WMY93_025264 [Mugilogobius chulae]|uniref:Uncharacterized protein n=1 Tax=Mugilogobius chulae TaxID=88201 RepID=A0AAW0N6D0_9GOBI